MLVKPLVRPIVRAIAGRATDSLGSGFSPSTLFSSGAKGAVYDASDLSTLYLDAAGTTAATVNGLVGLQLDKSAGLALGAELVTGNDSTFDSGVGSWATSATFASTAAAVGGEFQVTITAGFGRQVLTIPSTAGKTYKISGYARYVSGGAGTEQPMLGLSTATNGSSANYRIVANSTSYAYVEAVIVATGANIYATCGVNNTAATGATVAFDNISVVEIQGNHRTQSTTGSKPILRGSPAGGNTVTNPNFDSDVSWSKGAGWTIGSGVATATAATGFLAATMSTAVVASRVYRITYTIVTRTAGSVAPNIGGITGTSRSAAGTYVDWITSFNTGAFVFSPTTFSGTVDNVEVVDVSAGQVVAPYWLERDGVDDFFLTASVDFSGTDKVYVCSGVRKFSDSAQGMLVELTASLAANNGSFYLSAPESAGANFAFASKGTISATDTETGFAAPFTAVISGIGNISGDSAQLRVNGVAGTAVTTDQGTGNYANAVMYFGRRGGTSLPFKGLESRTVICGKTLSASELASTERWVNQQTLAY